MDPNSPIILSKSSGGYSARCPMTQGDRTPVPGPQVYFRERVQDPITGEMRDEGVPTMYTVRFGVIPPSVGANGASPLATTFECVAIVQSIVAGTPIGRTMNVTLGSAITLTGENVDVRLIDMTGDDFIPTGENAYPYSELADTQNGPQVYSVFVQIVPGIRPNYTHPPILKGITDLVAGDALQDSGAIQLAGGTSARYPVPPKAGVISVQVRAVNPNSASTDCDVIVAALGGATPTTSSAWNPQIDTGFQVLPMNTTYVTVTNLAPAETIAEITLTWGIEG